MKFINKHKYNVRPLVFLAMALLVGNSHAILPDNLTLDVGDYNNTGQDKTLVLTKRSARPRVTKCLHGPLRAAM